MAIGAEWILNKTKQRIYAVSHAKAVIRGNSNVDNDLTSIETNMTAYDTRISAAQKAADTNAASIVTTNGNVTKVGERVTALENKDDSAYVKQTQITQSIINSTTMVPSSKAVKEITDIYLADSAYLHNGIFRGKDLTDRFESGDLLDDLSEGSFYDIYVGDYFNFTYDDKTMTARVAGLNTFYNCGDTALTKPHIVIVCDEAFTTSYMNSTNTTANGYKGSYMNGTTIPAIVTNLKTVFGDHLLSSRELISNAVATTAYNRFGTASGASSGWEWTSQQAILMSEVEVYGSTVWSSSGYDTGNANRQLPLFRLAPEFINKGRYWYWLKDVASSSSFCDVSTYGDSIYNHASYVISVRPRFILG